MKRRGDGVLGEDNNAKAEDAGKTHVRNTKRRGGLQRTVGDRRRDVRGPGLAPARLRRVELGGRLLVREEALQLLRLWDLTSELCSNIVASMA